MHRPRATVRGLMMAVAFVALAIAWSSHFSDCKHQAALHATLASTMRHVFAGEGRGITAQSVDRQLRKAQWHEEMSRRFERAAWLPWPFDPPEPPRPR